MEMIRAGQIASLRGLGLSLAQVGRVLEGDSSALECALAAHAGQSYRRASAGFAEGDMYAAKANGGRDTAFAEVQADPGENFD
jgi:hypothetical protein